MRIGHGYDVHAFCAGDSIVLGGVRIAHSNGLLAHSDGDVVVHAVCDALLGAMGAGDIGRHFPDTDPELFGIDSRELLRRVSGMLAAAHLKLGNADVTIVAQVPRLARYVDEMSANMAADLGVPSTQINVKATTTEQLGYIGREEGIAVHAVAILSPAT